MDLKQKAWIWKAQTEGQENQYVCFRQEFFGGGEKTRVGISVDSDYALWVNGNFIDCGQYLARPDQKYYDLLSIADFVHEGKNVLCVLASYRGEDTQTYQKGEPGLVFWIESEQGTVWSGEKTWCAQVSGYVCGPIYHITPQLGFGYCYDACAAHDWTREDYAMDETWERAQVKDWSPQLPKALKKRPIPKLVHAGRAQAQITQEDGFIRSDLKKECAGLLSLDLEAEKEGWITISYGEHLLDGRVRRKIGSRDFSIHYRCKKGRQQFTGYFRRIAGRYLEIEKSDGINVHYLGIEQTNYPVSRKEMPKFRDPLDESIYQACLWTLTLCMHEHYEDCPWREQALYAMDGRTQALCGFYAFDDDGFVRESIRLLGNSLNPSDGFLELCAPAKARVTIPTFSLIWIVFAWEYLQKTGDKEAGYAFFSIACTMLERYRSYCSEGLLRVPQDPRYWNFYDWEEGLDGELDQESTRKPGQVDALLNLYTVMAYQSGEKMALYFGFEEKAKEYHRFGDGLLREINRWFWNPQLELYAAYAREGEQWCYATLTQALAILAGACDERRAAGLRKRILNGEGLIPAGLSYSLFLFDALLGDESYQPAVLQWIRKTWGYMLEQGADCFWETLKGAQDFDGAGSLCHGWSAVPLYVYHRYLGKLVFEEGEEERR